MVSFNMEDRFAYIERFYNERLKEELTKRLQESFENYDCGAVFNSYLKEKEKDYYTKPRQKWILRNND